MICAKRVAPKHTVHTTIKLVKLGTALVKLDQLTLTLAKLHSSEVTSGPGCELTFTLLVYQHLVNNFYIL